MCPAARCTLLTLLITATVGDAPAQLDLGVQAGYGPNILLSPGTDLQSAPGRTGHLALEAAFGRPGSRFAFAPALRVSEHAFRTRMAYRVHFTTVRNQFDLDLAVAIRQMSGTVWRLGGFVGRVGKVTNRIEQRAEDLAFPRYPLTTLGPDHYDRDQFGALLALEVPLDARHRWRLDLMARHHFTPLATDEQQVALVPRPPHVATATTTRPTTLSVGLCYRFATSRSAPSED